MKEMLKINDEDVRGNIFHSFRLPNNVDNLTVRDLVKLRIETEVKGFNIRRPLCFHSLIQPEGAEITPKGYRLKVHREIDWQAQYQVALDAFESKKFIISLSGKDLQQLDDLIETPDVIEINFVKFNNIVGG